MSKAEFCERMLAHICAQYAPGEPLRMDSPLLSSGVIDSFSIPEILKWAEGTLGRRISLARLTPDDFETVAGFAQRIEGWPS